RSSRPPGSRALSPSSTRSARGPRRRPWRTSCRRGPCRSASSAPPCSRTAARTRRTPPATGAPAGSSAPRGTGPGQALRPRRPAEAALALGGRALEPLVAAGEGPRDPRTDRLSGRSRDHRLVHFSLPEGITDAERPRPGDLVTATVTRAAPHYLIADSASGLTSGTWPDAERFSVRRTRSGDAWEAGQLGL